MDFPIAVQFFHTLLSLSCVVHKKKGHINMRNTSAVRSQPKGFSNNATKMVIRRDMTNSERERKMAYNRH